MLRNMTERQYSILLFIIETFKAKTQYPTIRQIGKQFGIGSTNGVHDHLQALMRRGWLVMELGSHRGAYFTLEARKELGLLFEFELKEMDGDDLTRRFTRPTDGRRFAPSKATVYSSRPRFGACSSLPFND